MKTAILPIVLIIIDIAQSFICVSACNYPKALYWFSAAVLTFSTILMK